MTDLPSGATGLLAGAISYTLSVCPDRARGDDAADACAGWDLATLLGHLSDSMADLETAIRTGHLDLEGPPFRARKMGTCPADGNPVEVLRDRAAELLCASYSYDRPESIVAVDGLPMPRPAW